MGAYIISDQQQGVLNLIRAALCQQSVHLPKEFSWEVATEQCRDHQISALIYEGIHSSGCDVPDEIMCKLRKSAMQAVFLDVKQREEVAKITAEFEAANIDYLTLKGINIKQLYPTTAIRTMSDADILIRAEQRDLVNLTMEKLGYIQKKESDHELIWEKRDSLIVELHKRLVPSRNSDYYSYYKDGWHLAQKSDDGKNAYEMSNEDEFVFLFVHFAKHYRDGGVGLRQLTDLYVYLHAYPTMDQAKIKNELEKLGLSMFFGYVKKTLDTWFAAGEWDERDAVILNHIFSGGAFGSHDLHMVSNVMYESRKGHSISAARVMRLLKLAFLPHIEMERRYPILAKIPFLLPIFWVWRVIRVLFLTKGKLRRHIRDFQKTSVKNVEHFQDEMNFVGLDFHLKD